MGNCTNVLSRETIFYLMGNSEGTPSAWGTELTGGTRLKLITDNPARSQDDTLLEETDTNGWKEDFDLGLISAGASPNTFFRYDDLRLMAYCLGPDNYAVPVVGSAGAYSHVVSPSEKICDSWVTLAAEKGANLVQVYPSLKITGFTLTGQPGPQPLSANYTGIASDLITDSTTITKVIIDAALAGPDTGAERVQFRQSTLEIADEGGVLAEIANILDQIVFSFQRDMPEEHTNSSGLKIEEPLEDGYPSAIFTISFRNLDAPHSTYYENWAGLVLKKVKFESTGSAIAAGDARSFIIEAERVKIIDVTPAPLTGGKIVYTMTLECLGDPDGTFVEPFQITSVNTSADKFIEA